MKITDGTPSEGSSEEAILQRTIGERRAKGCENRKAKELLLATSLRINEIAHALGFQQPQNFSNWFKKLEQTSPNAYREKLKKR